MRQGERLTVTLTGGAPWGFRLQGGGNFPLEVAKIRKRSNAADSGLREGDHVVSVNGFRCGGKSHQSAMDIVDMAGDKLTFEVDRGSSGSGASRPLDPQRQPRILPVVTGPGDAPPSMVSSAQAKFSRTDGNTRTDINTQEFVVKAPGGRKITKTVTEQRVTRYPGGSSPQPPSAPAASPIPPEYGIDYNRYPLQKGEHHSRTPNRTPSRSPLIWQPPPVSPSDNRANIPQSHSQPVSLGEHKSPLVWQPKSTLSPSPVAPYGSHSSQHTTPERKPATQPTQKPAKKPSGSGKENEDPIMQAEQAKWEAQQNVPTFSADNYGNYGTWGGRGNKKPFIPKKIDDPNYPMFDIPKTSWHAPIVPDPEPEPPQSAPQKIPPPVAPKPTHMMNGGLSPIPFDEDQFAGVPRHYPGMIPPPAQPNVKPAPPPPPMPIPPGPQTFTPLTKPRGFAPGDFSTPGGGFDEFDGMRPDHLPVFGPKVMFTPAEGDSGLALSPTRSTISDISAMLKTTLCRNASAYDGQEESSSDSSSGKVFSDSAFYDDSNHKYPTIDEQMSMCKRIADSLTSAANTRARGARMFAKRKRKADKWVHDQHPELFGFKSEYSSSVGDVADITDLDSELYYDEGGIKPLFTFRIPKVAGQISEGERMSLSKEEFERMRLGAPRVDHQSVSPNMCFSIAADLHKGGKNRGAKLFAKRQARVEKFVIDESNVQKPPMETRLEHIIQSPQAHNKPSPWNAAAQGNMQAAFDPRAAPRGMQQPQHYGPRHDLSADKKQSVLGGDNYNRKARGWQAGPAHQQSSVYREGEAPEGDDVTDNTLLLAIASPNEGADQWNTQQQQQQRSPSPLDYVDADPHAVNFGDYNRRIKAWPGAADPASQSRQAPPPQPQQQYNYSAQPNYNSLPRGFSYNKSARPQVGAMGACDL